MRAHTGVPGSLGWMASSGGAHRRLCFMLVAPDAPRDTVLYSLDLTHESGLTAEVATENQGMIRAAIDHVEKAEWECRSTFSTSGSTGANLRSVFEWHQWRVNAYVTTSRVRLLLLHEGGPKADDAVKAFFQDVHELFIKVQLNPFFERWARIRAPKFDERVRGLARKHLPALYTPAS